MRPATRNSSLGTPLARARTGRTARLGVLLALGAWLFASGAQAVTRTWDGGGGDGSWNTAANNDNDGKVDCADPDCDGVPECANLPTTTTTSTTSSTSSTRSTTTLVTTTTSTTTTLPAPQEQCDNCIDDDGNGLVDSEDPACCAAQSTLQVRKTRFLRSRRGGAASGTLVFNASLGLTEFAAADPTTEPVTIQLRKASEPVVVCMTVGAGKWKQNEKRRTFTFRDPLAKLVKGAFKAKRTNVAFSAVGKQIDMSMFDEPNVVGTVRVGNRCASGAVSLRTTKRGLVFP